MVATLVAMFDGVLLVNKEKEWTSHDVVAKVRSLLRQAALVQSYKDESQKSSAPLDFQTFKLSTRLPKVKVGHTGTLDPLATGLMVLVVGSYCKRAQEFSKLDKVYDVEMTLGVTSDTGDSEGQLQKVSDLEPFKEEAEHVINQFIGAIEQTPPAYSAIKIGGKKAYQLARAGKEVKLEPRQVKIYAIKNLAYAYPVIRFTAHVSSGTYIRSLVHDIGERLGTGAYMTGLQRTKVGTFSIGQAVTVEELQGTPISARIDKTV